LAEHKISLTGSDTPAFEKTPNKSFPAHVVLLQESGVYILECLNLEPLMEAKVFEFTLIILPLKIIGASGSPVRPIAII
jgi:kynurenine formamidase